MKSRNQNWLVLLGSLALVVACQSRPRFVNHPQPDLPAPPAVYHDGECLRDTSGECISQGTLAALGCDEIQGPPGLTGGLQPSYPLGTCLMIPDQMEAEARAEIEEGLYFFYTGGLFGHYIRYVVFEDGKLRLVKSEAEFRDLYAPIESPEEALSYVLALTNLSAAYGQAYDPAYRYEVNTIEDTRVTPDPDGYNLNMFHDAAFGCGPHWISEVEVHVSTGGLIREIRRTPLFRDPSLDDLCID